MDREERLAEVELSRKTVEEAIVDGLKELELKSRDEAEIKVISEGKPGFLGIGREMAVVVMRPKPPQRKRRRRRRRKGGDGNGDGEASRKASSQQKQGQRKSGGKAPQTGKPRKQSGERPKNRGSSGQSNRKPNTRESAAVNKERPEQADIATQAEVACSFLEGLIEAFGLEAEVSSRIEEDILFLDVSGEQSEALVGQRGAVLDSVLELTRTVVQRKTFGAPRMRLDIAGYTERRREALRIYAGKLAEKVKESNGEVGLEPMNPADRKVVHDAIAEIDGVRSFSEGQDQDRAVVIAPDGSDSADE
jgi:spoIIIJ-associated protein